MSAENGRTDRPRVPSIILPDPEEANQNVVEPDVHASFSVASPNEPSWSHHPYQEPPLPFVHRLGQPTSPMGSTRSMASDTPSQLRGHTGSTILREGVATLNSRRKKGRLTAAGEDRWYAWFLERCEPFLVLLRQAYAWGTEHERLTILVRHNLECLYHI